MLQEKTTVLLIDDEPSLHFIVGRSLRRAGYFVDEAKNGVVGLRMFKERSWDLVITDRVMPEMGGEELAEEIRKISPDVPLILITGFLKTGTRVELFDEILKKPFTRADLLSSISRAIERLSPRRFAALHRAPL